MKTKKYIIFVFFVVFIINLKAQEPQIQWTLPLQDGSYNTATKDYVARDKVTLTQGFNFQAASGKTFRARIDESLLFPADYNTQFTPTELYNSHTLNTGLTVGSIAGNGTVSPSGGSVYNVPIEIAPGVNAFVPQLSISYNSQSGNSLLGWGWSLNGLSSITRVPNTFYHDGFAKGIEFDSDSRYAIDGNRIIDPSGTYSTNSTFYTESETFSAITILGSYNDPTGFTIISKDGIKYEYNEKVNITSGGIQWMLSKVIDPFNNEINFTYSKADGAAWPISIDYAGGSCSVKFYYEERQDKTSGYVKGSEVKQIRILHKIKTIAANSLFREYDFTYQKTVTDLYSRLVEISMKSSDGSQVNSTVVDWGSNTQSYKISTPMSENNSMDFLNFSGDFDGDGKTDVIKIDKASTHYWIYLNSNNFNLSSTGILSQFNASAWASNNISKDTYSNQTIADFNSDGLDDIAISFYIGNDVYETRIFYNAINNYSNCNGGYFCQANSDTVEESSFPTDVLTGDFNGDGLADILTLKQNSGGDNTYFFNIWFKDKNTENFTMLGVTYDNVESIKSSDFNGNGKTDLTLFYKGDITFYPPAPPFPPPPPSLWHKINILEWNDDGGDSFDDLLPFQNFIETDLADLRDIYMADFNGDGKSDLMIQNGPTKKFKFYYSTGIDYILKNEITYSGKNVFLPVDFNNDGKTDLLTANWNQSTKLMNSFEIDNGTYWESYNHSFSNRDLPYFLLGDFNNDGKTDFMPIFSNTLNITHEYCTFNPSNEERLVKKIKNGMNIETVFNYSNLTNPVYYSKYPMVTSSNIPKNNGYPLKKIIAPITIVSSMAMNKVSGSGYNTTTFHYNDLTIHLTGKGFLGYMGFQSFGAKQNTENVFRVVDSDPGSETYSVELVSQNVKTNNNGATDLKTFTYEYNVNGRNVFQKTKTITDNHFVNGISETTYSYDDDGNMLNEKIEYAGDGTIIETTNSGFVSVNQWSVPSLPTSTTVKKTIDGDLYSLLTTLSWDKGKLATKSANGVSVTNTYNSNGTLQNTVTTGAGKSMSESYTYSNGGRFLASKTNPMGQTKMEYNNPFGLVSKIIDINNYNSSFSYDGLGRLRSKILPDGQNINIITTWNNGGPGFYTLKTSSGSPYVKTFYDAFGNNTGTETQGFNGEVISINNVYNEVGEVTDKNNPEGDNTHYVYDDWGRVLSEATTGLGTTSYLYTGRTIDITSPSGNFTNTNNCLGMLKTAIDPGGTTGYTYFGHGGVNAVTGAGAGTSALYNPHGFQTSLTDPDAGTISYTYNDLGQLETQVNPGPTPGSFITTTLQYDLAGRCTTKIVAGVAYTYEYDKQLKGTLSSVTSPNGMGIFYLYNSWGDIIQKTERIEGQDYVSKFEYNNKHNITKKTYPSGFAVTYNYDNFGNLKEIHNAVNGDLIWETTGMNKLMQVTNFNNGNTTGENSFTHGYPEGSFIIDQNQNLVQWRINTWESNFVNLGSRRNMLNALNEEFSYDGVQRCTTAVSKINNSVVSNLNMQYFPNGNIQSKSDAGDYAYTGNQPHAVTQIHNFTENISAVPQNITYNEFNKVSTIDEAPYFMEITYGTAADRRKSVLKKDGIEQWTKYYSEDFEKTIYENSSRELHYIFSTGGLCAIYVKNSISNIDTTYYIFKDHLGSITTITNNKDSKIQHLYYDMWGKRSIENTDYTAFLFDRGFTGHEHLEVFNLINMNGRVYDPVLGRFLSPDNYIQGAGSQEFNRYAYCRNNPLKYNDPDGEWLQFAIGAIFGGYSGYQLGKAQGMTGWDLVGYTLGGAVIGTMTAGIGAGIGGAISSSLYFTGAGIVGAGIGGATAGAFSGFAFSSLANGNVGESAWKGALSGFAGGAIGAGIGGGAGALLGGASSGGVGAYLNDASNEDIAKSALLGGAIGFGTYQAEMGLAYHNYNSGDMPFGELKYSSFYRLSVATERSFAWKVEAGGWILNNGNISKIVYGKIKSPSVDLPNRPSNAIANFHTHPMGSKYIQFQGTTDMTNETQINFAISKTNIYGHNPNVNPYNPLNYDMSGIQVPSYITPSHNNLNTFPYYLFYFGR